MRYLTSIAAIAALVCAQASQAVELQTLHMDSYINYWTGPGLVAGSAGEVTFDPLLATDPTNALPGQPLNPTVPLTLNSGPFSLELVPGATNTLSVTGPNLFESDFWYQQIGLTSLIFHNLSYGGFLTPGDDPDLLFPSDPNVAAFFNQAIAELNGNPATASWTLLMGEYRFFNTHDAVSGELIPGFSGAGSAASFTLDPGAAPVPVPAVLPLLGSALVGLGAFARRPRSATS